MPSRLHQPPTAVWSIGAVSSMCVMDQASPGNTRRPIRPPGQSALQVALPRARPDVVPVSFRRLWWARAQHGSFPGSVIEALVEFPKRGDVVYAPPGHKHGRGFDPRVLEVLGA